MWLFDSFKRVIRSRQEARRWDAIMKRLRDNARPISRSGSDAKQVRAERMMVGPTGSVEWFVCGLEGKMSMIWWYDPATLDVLQIDYTNASIYPVTATVLTLASGNERTYTLPANTYSEVLLKQNEVFNRDDVDVSCGFSPRASRN